MVHWAPPRCTVIPVTAATAGAAAARRRLSSYSSGFGPPAPSVSSLHAADGAWALERCVLSMHNMQGMSAASHAVWRQQPATHAEVGQAHSAVPASTSASASSSLRSSALLRLQAEMVR